jgi:hypothetical protein
VLDTSHRRVFEKALHRADRLIRFVAAHVDLGGASGASTA